MAKSMKDRVTVQELVQELAQDPEILPRILRMAKFGWIEVRSVATDQPLPDDGEVEADPAGWYLSQAHANGVREAVKVKQDHERQIERQGDRRRQTGRYTLEEAAQMFGTATGSRADWVLEKLMAAAHKGDLPVYPPVQNSRYLYNASGFQSHVRAFYEEVHWDDLNAWLDKNEPRVTWRFPDPKATTDDSSGAAKHGEDWKDLARAIADELYDHDTALNCRDCLLRKTRNGAWGGYAARVLDVMRERGIHGPRGPITNPRTIARAALQGGRWWGKKPK